MPAPDDSEAGRIGQRRDRVTRNAEAHHSGVETTGRLETKHAAASDDVLECEKRAMARKTSGHRLLRLRGMVVQRGLCDRHSGGRLN